VTTRIVAALSDEALMVPDDGSRQVLRSTVLSMRSRQPYRVVITPRGPFAMVVRPPTIEVGRVQGILDAAQ